MLSPDVIYHNEKCFVRIFLRCAKLLLNEVHLVLLLLLKHDLAPPSFLSVHIYLHISLTRNTFEILRYSNFELSS